MNHQQLFLVTKLQNSTKIDDKTIKRKLRSHKNLRSDVEKEKFEKNDYKIVENQ